MNAAPHEKGAVGGGAVLRTAKPEELVQMRLAQAEWFRRRGKLAEAQELEREPLQ